jgi:phospholipid-binding lipoprotein MlaA
MCSVVLMGISGCAAGPTANPADPLEPMNRRIYRFNEVVDGSFLKPLATAYRNVTPDPVRTGVSNFFANLGDVWSFVNNVLQFKGNAAAETFMRFNVNTVLGVAGLFDLASEMGLDRHREDFGQTLGKWGVPPGPYLVLPVLGASSLRDATALRADTYGSPVADVEDVPTRNSLLLLQAVETRARLLGASAVLDQAALDDYSFTRDAYLQKRRNDVYDGNPPEEPWPAEPAPAEPEKPASACSDGCPKLAESSHAPLVQSSGTNELVH